MIKVYIPIFFSQWCMSLLDPIIVHRILFYFLLFPCCMPRGVVSEVLVDVLSPVEHTVIVLETHNS